MAPKQTSNVARNTKRRLAIENRPNWLKTAEAENGVSHRATTRNPLGAGTSLIVFIAFVISRSAVRIRAPALMVQRFRGIPPSGGGGRSTGSQHPGVLGQMAAPAAEAGPDTAGAIFTGMHFHHATRVPAVMHGALRRQRASAIRGALLAQ